MKKYLPIAAIVLSASLGVFHLMAYWQSGLTVPHLRVVAVTLPMALLSVFAFARHRHNLAIAGGIVSIVWEVLVVYTDLF